MIWTRLQVQQSHDNGNTVQIIIGLINHFDLTTNWFHNIGPLLFGPYETCHMYMYDKSMMRNLIYKWIKIENSFLGWLN